MGIGRDISGVSSSRISRSAACSRFGNAEMSWFRLSQPHRFESEVSNFLGATAAPRGKNGYVLLFIFSFLC